MELVETLEINGEEREIADAYARGQCAANAQNIATNAEGIDELNNNLSQLEYSDVAGGKNKIDVSKIQYGFELDSTGQPTTKVGWYVTDYISVNPSTKYMLSGISSKYVYEFDENKQFIKIIDAKSGVFETSATTKFIRLNSVANGYSTPQLEEGTTATEYEPYIPSVKMLADEVSAQNESLADYGLNNLYDGLTRNGYYSGAGAFTSNNGAIANVNPYKCKAGDIITIKTDITRTDSRIVFLNSSGGAVSYVDNDFDKVSVPANATSFVFNFSPTNFNHIGVYINNAIDELKNDLSEKLKVISVSLSDVMVSAMSSTTVDLPQEYIDAGYVIANILSKPDTGLSYTTGSETSIIIRNNTDSAVAFAPTATVKVLIAKIG